jgi:hypothetical protein
MSWLQRQLSENCLVDDPPKYTIKPGITLTANSTATLTTSSAVTQGVLVGAINNLRENALGTTTASTGHYITPAGQSRVVWTRRNDEILVLTIYAPGS